MKLSVMTTPYFFIEEHQILTVLFEEGLETLHLRKPETEPVYSERLLSLIPAQYRRRIVVHDYFYLKNEYGLRGIHLNQRNPELPSGYKGHISCTCQTFDEVSRRKKMMDYVLLSPIFGEAEDNTPTFSAQQITAQSRSGLIDKKVYAMGGVTIDNIRQLRDWGFGGAVVYGDIWNRFNQYANQDFKDIIAHFRKLRKAAE